MEWTPGGSDQDIEDRRNESSGGGFGGGRGFGVGGLGIGGVIIVGILSLVFQKNLFTLFSGEAPQRSVRAVPDPQRTASEQPQYEFVKYVLNDAQATWNRLVPQEANRPYRHAKLVLFRNAVRSGCGVAQDATGPFYCPEDEKVYLDLSFFDDLRNRFGAPGEFAQAYVIAHEIGHHVQKILGVEPKVRRLQEANPGARNPLSVRLELQADCFAGVWAHATTQRSKINESDVESALGAAAAVGDDRIQRMARGRVSPESFTHGSSAQRTGWFKRGLESGQLSSCNTFQAQ